MPKYLGDPVKVAQSALISGTDNLFDILPKAVKLIIRDELWKDRNDRQGGPFESFEAFVLHSLPEGLEIASMDRLVDFVRDSSEVVKMVQGEMGEAKGHGGVEGHKGQNEHSARVDNVNTSKQPKGGNHKSYLLKRLKRDNPEIAEDYIQGNYPSVRQAAIAAGIVKVKTPLEIALAAFRKLTDEEKVTFEKEVMMRFGGVGKESNENI